MSTKRKDWPGDRGDGLGLTRARRHRLNPGRRSVAENRAGRAAPVEAVGRVWRRLRGWADDAPVRPVMSTGYVAPGVVTVQR